MSRNAEVEPDREARGEPRSRTDAFGSATGHAVLVAVIDSGWNRDLPDERVLPGIGLVDPDDELRPHRSSDDHDRAGHGTLCTTLMMDVAPEVRVLPIRVFGRRIEGSLEQIRQALILAGESGVAVVSLSLATLRADGLRILYPACESLAAAGILVVAAAFRPKRIGFPAMFANVIGVEAAPVPGPFDFWYQTDSPIECGAYGWGSTHEYEQESNSAASARIAGILALYRETNKTGTIDDARAWLAEHATNPVSVKAPASHQGRHAP